MLQLEVKAGCVTPELAPKLGVLRDGEAGGMRGVAVKCVEIRRNTSGEGGLLNIN